MRTKGERAITWWNSAAQMRPVLDSSSFIPVPMFPHKLATILLLAFLLLCYRSVCVQKATKRMEESVNTHNRLRYFLTNKIFLLQVMYRCVRMFFTVKCITITHFFHCLYSTLMEKNDFYYSVIPWNCTWYCTVQGLYFFIAVSSLED
jgi:hypothetical protein